MSESRFCVYVALGRPFGAAPLAADCAGVLLFHRYNRACQLVVQRHGHVPKIDMGHTIQTEGLNNIGRSAKPDGPAQQGDRNQ